MCLVSLGTSIYLAALPPVPTAQCPPLTPVLTLRQLHVLMASVAGWQGELLLLLLLLSAKGSSSAACSGCIYDDAAGLAAGAGSATAAATCAEYVDLWRLHQAWVYLGPATAGIYIFHMIKARLRNQAAGAERVPCDSPAVHRLLHLRMPGLLPPQQNLVCV